MGCKKENMRIIGAVSATVPTNFFRSLGDHEYEQTHAPEDFDYDQAVTDIQDAQAALTAAQANIALKAWTPPTHCSPPKRDKQTWSLFRLRSG